MIRPPRNRLVGLTTLSAMWNDSEFATQMWASVEVTLGGRDELTSAERGLLLELLKRSRKPAARKALGFKKTRARTADRNDGIADLYLERRAQGDTADQAKLSVTKKYPGVVGATLEGVLEDGKRMGYARARRLAKSMSEKLPNGGEGPIREVRSKSTGPRKPPKKVVQNRG